MKDAHIIDEARLGIMLNELRLPTIKTLWPQFAGWKTVGGNRLRLGASKSKSYGYSRLPARSYFVTVM
ncbi:hypothetical protein [Mesorhizobium sp.]|uniref:hypothetical protein n=1 Tax=Mesorhizobium sp. TaxID=1871066 RepID=UPI0011FFF707|nr:hypothetical protein [Mesorhizobium sp.]TIS55794.1 MAG: hypothetical protein E5W91_20590 [Mesorhizobium sp.]TIS89806.1 MAG: hypothetical protein E5W89_15000 [Mesorhizobium sp.]TJW42782.1 MAG: hypothetical protein E5W83_19695 [Mesorhizobium sp.]